MKFAIASICLFIVTAFLFATHGCYDDPDSYRDEYWACVYYIPLYLMISSMARYMMINGITRLRRWFFGSMVLYGILGITLHTICLFHIEWYGSLVGYAYFGLTPAAIIAILIVLNAVRLKIYLQFKSHGQ
jgi:hypothetical protein